MNYCVGCGEKKRIRWYGGFCTKDCAAHTALALFGAEPLGFCPGCGELSGHTLDCPFKDEGEL